MVAVTVTGEPFGTTPLHHTVESSGHRERKIIKVLLETVFLTLRRIPWNPHRVKSAESLQE